MLQQNTFLYVQQNTFGALVKGYETTKYII